VNNLALCRAFNAFRLKIVSAISAADGSKREKHAKMISLAIGGQRSAVSHQRSAVSEQRTAKSIRP